MRNGFTQSIELGGYVSSLASPPGFQVVYTYLDCVVSPITVRATAHPRHPVFREPRYGLFGKARGLAALRRECRSAGYDTGFAVASGTLHENWVAFGKATRLDASIT